MLSMVSMSLVVLQWAEQVCLKFKVQDFRGEWLQCFFGDKQYFPFDLRGGHSEEMT